MNPGFGILAVVLLLAVLRAARTLFGRQRLLARQLLPRLVLPVVAGVALGVVTASDLLSPAAVGAGLAAGVAVALLAYRLTRFEQTPAGLYFRPNTYVGAAVLVFLLGRIVSRVIAVAPVVSGASAGGTPGSAGTVGPPIPLGGDPLTVASYFVLIGFYVCYAAALLRRLRRERSTGLS